MFSQIIEKFVNNQIKNQLTKATWINDSKFEWLVHDAIWSLVGWLANNATKPQWAESLLHAVKKDHDGSSLDNIGALVWGWQSGQNILDHILWSKQEGIEKLLWAKNGVDSAKVWGLLKMLAPIILAQLGKKINSEWIWIDTLMSMFKKEKRELTKDKSELPILAFLDKDGDGDVDINDFLKMTT